MTFVGEGIMVGVGSFGVLAAGQVVATASLIAALTLGRCGTSLPAVWATFYLFNGIRFANVIRHHLYTGPLAPRQLAMAADGGNPQ